MFSAIMAAAFTKAPWYKAWSGGAVKGGVDTGLNKRPVIRHWTVGIWIARIRELYHFDVCRKDQVPRSGDVSGGCPEHRERNREGGG